MQITYDKLGELTGLSVYTIRLYMDSFRLYKYQTTRKCSKKTRHYMRTVVFNQNFINDFTDYLKIKWQDYNGFKTKATELLNKYSKKS